MKMRSFLLTLGCLILVLGVLVGVHSLLTIQPPLPPLQTHPAVLAAHTQTDPETHVGVRTKTNGCLAQGPLPDPGCSPGAVFPTATVEQICTSGYSASVRDVPESEKKAVFAEYGITSHPTGAYEVDHLISLELGGSNDIANLWPEPAEPVPGFHQKDIVENFLHTQVCNGSISLLEAQQRIAGNWLDIFQQMRD